MSKQKTAILTGITGQDATFLSKILIDNGYKVYGGIRRNSDRNLHRLNQMGIVDKIEFIEFELLDYSNIYSVINEIKPDEFYNLAAQSFVGTSFKQPISTYQMNAMGVGYILDVLKTVSPETKFYTASSSEQYGKVKHVPLNEDSPFHPRSPYGVAKLFAHWATVNYRESFDMFCCAGILFNHESEFRGKEFVTRKISHHVAQRHYGSKEILQLGNLDSVRDWGYAKEYCEGMFQMMQQPKADTYVLATGRAVTVREFAKFAFSIIGNEVEWEGVGINEKGFDKRSGDLLITINPKYYRPAEVELLLGDSKKAYEIFGWKAKTTVEKLAEIMVENDINLLRK